jgi:anti-sigma B factor antagonist
MPITKTTTPEGWELLVPGRIDGDLAHQLEVEISNAIRGGAQSIRINLSQATFLCSAGIRVLLQSYRQMKGANKKLRVSSPSPAVASILELTGFSDLIVEK